MKKIKKVKKPKTREQLKNERKEQTRQEEVVIAMRKNEFITNHINAQYYIARVNMIAKQLHNKMIFEDIDGAVKTEEYMQAEYALIKLQAIKSMRNAHFAKEELMKKHKFTDKDIEAIKEDYINGKIIRDSYEEAGKGKSTPQFVPT